MSSEVNKERAYGIIEPPIYEELDWDVDLVMSCLEVIRTKLPELFPDFPQSIEFELISFENPFGEPYPVIGLYSDNPNDLDKIPELLDIEEQVNNWLKSIGIESIKKESKKLNHMAWETLKKNLNS